MLRNDPWHSFIAEKVILKGMALDKGFIYKEMYEGKAFSLCSELIHCIGSLQKKWSYKGMALDEGFVYKEMYEGKAFSLCSKLIHCIGSVSYTHLRAH